MLDDIEAEKGKSASISALENHVKNALLHDQFEPNVFQVDWNATEDSENPRNFSLAKKVSIIGTISLITFFGPLVSLEFCYGY